MKTLEERISLANAELREIGDWFLNEQDKITRQLEESGIALNLDGNRKAYKHIYEEFNRQLSGLWKKYDLPPDTKLKLR